MINNNMKIILVSFIFFTVVLSCKTKINDKSTQSLSSKENLDSFPVGRRVVTGFDKNGKSIIMKDGLAPKLACWYYPDFGKGYNAWLLKSVPTDLSDTAETMNNGYDSNELPKGGVIARIITWFPGAKYPMHQTKTVDFGIVLSGNLKLILEADSTILGPGDLVVQQNTPHSWAVEGNKPCTIAFILVDGKTNDKKSTVK
ncbi:MAG TPA: cupin domain-containing protein [Bacteroidia bacterium]|nr:cupin domain-containing protein [Bacteroidia bacterium]